MCPSLAQLVDEVTRLNGRFKSLFANVRATVGLSDTELLVLTAVVAASRPPTVPQIGRSLGQPRQVVQRAANSLIDAGLIDPAPNPHHKRAVLLVATSTGIATKAAADRLAAAITDSIAIDLEDGLVASTAVALGLIRHELEAALRRRGAA